MQITFPDREGWEVLGTKLSKENPARLLPLQTQVYPQALLHYSSQQQKKKPRRAQSVRFRL